ncbi:MAG: cyclodeaminase/cyclohydrolase family protein [Candidatus Omnitrophica bacterium]|nr:cyclodeaminase/cyclohydrolase family protein [Candidatus Omnitrophota bacterium]
MVYLNQNLKKYLDDLADKKPAPGGGSAAALVSAMGSALISMVCNFTIGRKKYKEMEEEVKKFFEDNESLRFRLMELIDLDITAYEKVNQIRKAVKENSKEKDRIMFREAIREAIAVPLEVCQLSIRVLKICRSLVDITNINLISDLYASASLLKAGFQSALVNIEINLNNLKDCNYIVEIRKIIEPLIKENETISELIKERVKEKMFEKNGE